MPLPDGQSAGRTETHAPPATGTLRANALPPAEAWGADTPSDPPDVLVATRHVSGADYRVRRRKGSGNWLLTYTNEGGGIYRLGDAVWRVGPGDMCLLAPGLPHDYGTDPVHGQWDFWWAHFNPRPGMLHWMQWPTSTPGLACVRMLDPRAAERAGATFARLAADLRGRGALGEELALCALEELLLLAERERRDQTDFRTVDPRVRAVLEHLAENLEQPVCAAKLAGDLALSPSRLRHLFKSETGIGLVEALTTIRLRQAARLLELTDRSVAQIAQEVGFASPFYFSRRFAARFGTAPRAYRSARRQARAD